MLLCPHDDGFRIKSIVLSLMAESHFRLGHTSVALQLARNSHSIAPLAFHSLTSLSWITAMIHSADDFSALNEALRLAALAEHIGNTCPLPKLFQVSRGKLKELRSYED